MHFLVLADIHANMDYLDALDAEFAKADAVLVAGDFSDITDQEKGVEVLNALIKKNDALYAVIGNCDRPEFSEELEKRDVSVEGTMVFRDGLAFTGSGGSLIFTRDTPNERTEEELLGDLRMVFDRSGEYEPYPFDDKDAEESADASTEKEPNAETDADGAGTSGALNAHTDASADATADASTVNGTSGAPLADASAQNEASAQSGAAVKQDASHEWQNLVVILHHPPRDTKLDLITAGFHVGSTSFRTFIEEYKPLVAIAGHIHESRAIDTLGATTLINPGSLAEGKYAVLEVQKQNGSWKVVKAELKEL